VLSAMALGAHYSAGAICRGLRDKSRSWLQRNFALAAAEPSFLALPVAEVVALVESEDLEAKEEEVFAAVLSWVKEDEAGRQAELSRLLPLIRFPLMDRPGAAIMAEPLVAQHATGMQLLYETTAEFAASAQASACPRLLPRASVSAAPVPRLAFTRAADCYAISGEGGALMRCTAGSNGEHYPAVCAGHRMTAGRHAADFTFYTEQAYCRCTVGVARPQIELLTHGLYSNDFWGVHSYRGDSNQPFPTSWDGMQGFKQGDVVGLLLDCDAGTLTVKKNGVRLGVATTGLTGEFCWAATLYGAATPTVRITAADAALF
jgi:hypothetical protein